VSTLAFTLDSRTRLVTSTLVRFSTSCVPAFLLKTALTWTCPSAWNRVWQPWIARSISAASSTGTTSTPSFVKSVAALPG
jgi:hypothetical protein